MQDQTFEDWMDQVDKIFLNYLGLSYEDVADYHWRDLYDAGMSPQEAWEDWEENNDDGWGAGE